MTKRLPLDLMQKWKTHLYWIGQKPPLTRSALVVLSRLLNRQNTKTGRCDPSVIGIVEETGVCERSVRGAFKELETRGALKRYRANRRSRNQFMIFSVAELNLHRSFMKQKIRGSAPASLQSVAAPCATHCRSNLQPAAPKTIKETIKKKGNAERLSVDKSASCGNTDRRVTIEFSLGEFEQRIAKVFEREGYGYEGLLTLPAAEMETVFGKLRSGSISFNQAAGKMLDRYRVEQDRLSAAKSESGLGPSRAPPACG